MDQSFGPGSALSFGPYVFDAPRRRLRRGRRTVALPAKAFDILAMLIERRGAAVSREELYQRLWPEGAVEDGNITQGIYLVRRALDPGGDGRRYIETLPRIGYRFVPDVRVAVTRRPWFAGAATGLARAAALAVSAAVLVSASSNAAVPLEADAAVAYSLGRFHVDMRGRENLLRSLGYFERIVREAPRSAAGYAGLATAYGLLAEFDKAGSPAYVRDLARAREMRAAALRRDPANAEAHAASAFLAYRFDDDPAAAEREFRAAFATDDRNAEAHHWHAVFLITRGNVGGAVAELELARRLDPTSEVILRWLGRGYYLQRRPDAAIRTFNETLAIRPTDGAAWIGIAASQEQKGEFADALQTLREAVRHVPYEAAYAIPAEARLRLKMHRRSPDSAQTARADHLADRDGLDPFETTLFYVTAGDRRRALAALRRGARRSSIETALIWLDPLFEPLRSDAAFRAVFMTVPQA